MDKLKTLSEIDLILKTIKSSAEKMASEDNLVKIRKNLFIRIFEH